MGIIQNMPKYIRFISGFKRFIKDQISLKDCHRIIKERMNYREELFLDFFKKGIYEYKKSPYLRLFGFFHITFEDIRRLVLKYGIEGTLKELRAEGVYITNDEFKCRRPLVRKGRVFEFMETDFDNPFLSSYYKTMTGGTSGCATRTYIDLDFLSHRAMYEALMFELHDIFSSPIILWLPCVPLHTGLYPMRLCKIARPPVKWFSQINPRIKNQNWKTKLTSLFIHRMPKLLGVDCPLPEYASLNDAYVVARYVSEQIQEFSQCFIHTFPSSAIRICTAAKRNNWNIKGTKFITAGEPLTYKKKQIIESMGAEAISAYYFTEMGFIGCGCGYPNVAPDDIHIFKDSLAIIQHQRKIEGIDISVNAFLFTSLLPSSPKLMLNVENGDYGDLETKRCGCPLDQYGFLDHISNIRSFEKFKGEGMSFLGADLIKIIEEIFPETFGAEITDFQLIEEEEEDGTTVLSILVHPRLGEIDEEAIIEVLKREFNKRNSRIASLLMEVWNQSNSIRVRRKEPIPTMAGKLYPFYIKYKNSKI